MTEEFLKRIPTWLIGVALILFALIVIVQRFILGQPIYADGDILPSHSIATSNGGTDLPAGAVMAFDRPSGCPESWERFWPAGGRFIIGAGNHDPGDPNKRNKDQDGEDLSVYLPAFDQSSPDYQTGGKEKLVLTDRELPTHTHSYTGVTATAGAPTGKKGSPLAWGERTNPTETYTPSGSIGETGKQQPLNNMPPYIALYFCKYAG